MYKDLPLMDLDFGVSQLSGNKGLLISLLTKFNLEYASAKHKLSGMLDAGDLTAAKVFVHTVKGVTGNLGMKALSQISKELELLYREQQTNEEKYQLFCEILEKTISYNEALADEINQEDNLSLGSQKSAQKLIELLKQNAFISKDVLNQLLDQLELPEETIKQLYVAIDDLEYPTALKLLSIKPTNT